MTKRPYVIRRPHLSLTIAQAEPSREFEDAWRRLFAPLLGKEKPSQESRGRKVSVDHENDSD